MLQIQPSADSSALQQTFTLIGTVDIEAINALESLYIVPNNAEIVLDFALVQRVNSMGLAQLLKLFEHWQKKAIHIQVHNTNRMIGVLFKMTGLNRFLTQDSPAESPTKTPAYVVEQTAQQEKDGKLKLWVNAQSSHQMNGWYFFNTYLQRQLNREIQLELVHGAMNEQTKQIQQADIVFTKPFEATRLLLEHRFRPLLRPSEQTDEVALLVRQDDTREKISDFNSAKVVTAAPDNFVYLLGRFLLEEDNSQAKQFDYIFSGHDIKALQMLLKGSADILFMLNDTYDSLSNLTKKMLKQIDKSETAFAFHLFCAAPHCTQVGEAMSEVLLNMNQDSQGRQVLADLQISGWSKPKQDEINMLAMLFERYTAPNPVLQKKAM